jgi:hypothetical protein
MKLNNIAQQLNVVKELKEIKNAVIECGASSNRNYWNCSQDFEPWTLVFKIDTKEVDALAKFWNLTRAPVMVASLASSVGTNVKKALETPNCRFITAEVCRAPGSSIKFKAQTLGTAFPGALEIATWTANPSVFVTAHTPPLITPVLIETDPVELYEKGHTYRLLTLHPNVIAMLVDEENPLYNYIDRNHVVVFLYTKTGTKLVITNQLNFDTTLVLNALRLDPSKLELLTAGVFLDHRVARQLLIRLEQALTGPALTYYDECKNLILKDFQDNAQSVMVTKMLRGEVPHTIVNEITIKKNSVKYHNVSLETPLLETLIATYGDLTEIDIYAIIAKFGDLVEQHFEYLSEGDSNRKHLACSINEIQISVTHSGAQRKINGIRINQAELSKVIQMAACHRSAESYNRFLAEVSRFSLRCASALAEGLFVAICNVDGGRTYNRRTTAPTLTKMHPKLEFVRENKDIMLKIDDTSLVKIYRFAGLVNSVDSVNGAANGNYTRNRDRIPPCMRNTAGDLVYKTQDWVMSWLKDFVVEHTRKHGGLPVHAKLNKAGLDEFENYIRRAQKEAIARSQKLLARVIEQTKTTAFSYKGREGYKVVGKLREYFVAAEDNKVYNLLNDSYVCIVDDARHSGVGADPLCARLLALRNDSVMADVVTTLAIRNGEKLLATA